MHKPVSEIMSESRAGLLRASEFMDEGKYRQSVDVCVRSAELSLRAMLVSWNLAVGVTGCWEMLKTFGVGTSTSFSSWLRHCCKRIDRHRAFLGQVDDEKLDRIIDEEYAMEMINYGREIIKFSQRNLYRDESDDPS